MGWVRRSITKADVKQSAAAVIGLRSSVAPDHERAPGPDGRLPVVAVATLIVAAGAGGFAHFYRDLIDKVIDVYGSSTDPTVTAGHLPRIVVGVLVACGVIVAAELSRFVRGRRSGQLGLGEVDKASRGEGQGPALRATVLHALANFVAMCSLSSLGRESPILETGGSIGSVAGRRIGDKPSRLAATGVAAAFAVAYHAPLGSYFYVREHVLPGAGRRARIHAAIGAAFGLAITLWVFRSHRPFPNGNDPLSGGAIALTMVGILPAYVATLAFRRARQWATKDRFGGSVTRRRLGVLAAAMVAGVVVAGVPLVAGNGMDLIRRGAVEPTLGIAAAMLFAKFVATGATFRAGAPGGFFSPSLAVAMGAALVTLPLANQVGIGSPDARWDAMLGVAAVAVALGTHAPLTACVVIAELSGDIRIVPLSILVVIIVQGLEVGRRKLGLQRPRPLIEEPVQDPPRLAERLGSPDLN